MHYYYSPGIHPPPATSLHSPHVYVHVVPVDQVQQGRLGLALSKMLPKEGVEPSGPASNVKEYQQQQQQQHRARHDSSDSGEIKMQEREEGTVTCSNPHRLHLGDSSSRHRETDVEQSLPQTAQDAPPGVDELAAAEGRETPGLGVSLSESMENGRAAATFAATAADVGDADAGDCGHHGEGEDGFEVNEDVVTDFKYDYKEAICLDLSRAGGVAAVATTDSSTPGAATPVDVAAGASGKGGARHGANPKVGGTNTDTNTNTAPSTGGVEASERTKPSRNEMDMSVSGKNDMRRFSAAVAATATDNDANHPAPPVIGLSRRKAPMTPAVRYLMEAMCTDLQCCGECFVPHFRAGQTLVRFCGFVPFAVDEGLDEETRRFMEGENAYGIGGGGEAYGRGIGLPGIAWASSMASLVEISTLTSDESFDCGGVR